MIRNRTVSFFSIILVINLVLSACGAGAPPALQATAVSTGVHEEALASRSNDTVVTAAPTATPQLLPPVVASIKPGRGEEQPLTSPIVITFDQAMDAESTRAAFGIEPATAGTVVVTGDELSFTPSVPLERDTSYTISVADTAQSSAGLNLLEPVVHDFQTVGLLEVSSTQPAEGTTDVAVKLPITVAFNRPVVPLTGASGQAGLPQPLEISPEADGVGKWLNTSIYQFTPKGGLAASTAYSVTVKAGLTGADGSVLDQDYIFSFRTTDPAVTMWRPENNINLPIQSAISVTFSMPMDRISTEEAFTLRDDAGSSVEGAFTWSLKDTVLGFKPSRALEYGQRYTAEVETSARAANGKGNLRDTTDRSHGFLAVSLPEVVRTDPRGGNLKADPTGGIAFYFKSPMDPASFVTDSLTILPKPSRVYTGYNPYDNVLWVDFNKLPATSYEVTLSGNVADPYGNLLGEDFEVAFRTRDYDPMLQIDTPAQVGTYNAYTDTEAVITYRNVPEIGFSLYNTPLQDYLLMTGSNWWEAWDRYLPNQDALIHSWTEKTTARPNRTARLRSPITDAEGQQLPPGLYYLTVTGQDMASIDRTTTRRLLARTDLNIVLKAGQDEALAWVTDLKSGQPVAGVNVRFFSRDKIDVTVTTDSDGVARLEDMKTRQAWEPLVAIGSSASGQFGVASSEWQTGISPWDFDLPGGMSSAQYNAYVYTDRPIYRPGQTVYWKAIVRRDDDAQYSLPDAGQAMTVTINDDRGNTLLEQLVRLTPQGTADGELDLATDATLGYYFLSTRLDDDTSYGVGFQVAEYRKPEYELTAATDKPEYIQGEQVNVTVKADYFFGAPVKNARVKWVLLSADSSFSPPGMEGYSFSDWNWYDDGTQNPFGRELGQGEGVTDAEGRFTFVAPADISQFKESQRFTFDITVTDANNQPVSTQASALVHKGAFYIGLKPEEYVAEAGYPTAMAVVTVDPQGVPVANTEVTLVVNQVEWRSVRQEAEDGRFYWTTVPQKTAIMTETVRTNFAGEASLEWKPLQAGDHKIEATARDRAGHTIRSAAWVWVTGPEYTAWRQENNDRIQLIPDQLEYEVGDTARVLVASPYQGDVMALLAVERGGILEYEVIELTGNSQVLDLPVKAEYAPNAFVSLVIVKGMDATSPSPSFRAGLAELKVSVAGKVLEVTTLPQTEEVTADGEPKAGPREAITYEVQTLDSEGAPVSADVSLALVDKAVLSLADDQAGTMVDRFYSERPDGIQTATTLVVNVDRLVAQVPEGGKGGGGGGFDAGAFTVRSEFLDLAFWQATVRTGSDGKARVEVTLPDNLTTWTMDARAASPETLVGQSQSDLIATKELLIRPSLPRFFVDGDRAEIGGIIQNNTDREQSVRIRLQAEGLEIGAPAAVDALIPAQGSSKVTWPVTVVTAGSDVTVEMVARAETGDLSDALRITLPVHRYSTPEVTGTSGEVGPGETKLEAILVPNEAEPDRGGLEVVIEPSLAAGMRGGLDYLEHYPYECVEQTLSRFLPNVVTYAALRDLDLERPGLESDLRQQVSVGLQGIYAKQHIDGGWGWWQTDDSNLFVTAYVVFGLAQAREAGFAVDPAVLTRGAQYLQQNLKAPQGLSSWQANQQAFIVYALAEAGVFEPNRAGALYEQREKLSLYAKAYLAMALDLIGDDAAPARVRTLLDEISGAAVASATGTHWEEAYVDYRNMNSDVRTTAIVLEALATLDPDNALAPNAVRWLMAIRNADRWETTQENAWSIMALSDWMAASGELEGQYGWEVRLNGAQTGSGSVTPETVEATTVLQMGMDELLRDRTNALEIERSDGPGKMYYNAHLQTYLPADSLEPLSRGITVNRSFRLADCDAPDGETCPPVMQARVGDVLEVVVDLTVPDTMHYLILESPLPAGLEAIDSSLGTTSATVEGVQMEMLEDASGQKADWWWTPTDVEMRDEKTALFATELAPGSYRFVYQARASVPGEFLTLPPTGYQMYFPEVWGRGAGSLFTVVE